MFFLLRVVSKRGFLELGGMFVWDLVGSESESAFVSSGEKMAWVESRLEINDDVAHCTVAAQHSTVHPQLDYQCYQLWQRADIHACHGLLIFGPLLVKITIAPRGDDDQDPCSACFCCT